MAKIQVVPVKKSEAEEIQALTVQTQTAMRLSSKELKEEEKNIIRAAEKLPVSEYPIIYPLQGTIGFMTRNMEGGNTQAIEFVRASIPQVTLRTGNNFLVDLVREFDKLDEASQNRIDCLDHLARKNGIGIARFIDAMADGVEFISKRMTTMVIAAKRPDLAAKILKSAENESLKSVAHKKLAANISGLEQKESPLVKVETGNKITNNTQINQNVVLSFSDFQKEQDKLIRGANSAEEKEFVDGELVNE